MLNGRAISGREVMDILDGYGIAYEVSGDFAALTFRDINEYGQRIGAEGLYFSRAKRAPAASVGVAVANGAIACVADQEVPANIPYLRTPRVYEAATLVSRTFYDDAASKIEQVLIVGTKGKTTTTRILHSVLSEAGDGPVAYCSTNRSFDGVYGEHFDGTVSDPTVFYPLCLQARLNGCKHMVSEMPSYAELFHRLIGLTFPYGIFTNLDFDHVSSFGHPSYQDYVDCKKRMVARCQSILVNRDDPRYGEFLDAAAHADVKRTYSIKEDNDADFRTENIERRGLGHAFTAVTPTWRHEMVVSMPGVFNVSNALAAIGQAWAMGVEPHAIARGIAAASVEGRMEAYEHNGYLAFVDYAHNGISFRSVFESLRQDYPGRKVVVISGIGGGVSEYCHTDVADAIARYADRCIVTTDNPMAEDPVALCQGLRDGIVGKGGSASVILDRAEAIQRAVQDLKLDEILLVAGKGEDREQCFFDHVEPYEGDDVLTQRFIAQK